ncbi:predicted protein [Naegleria gruberi]|uniref:Predicted protein n=1 Tax=Naegleria gruberi TaxID=5762 RepID=D2W3E1_NAEGR|nr:uncharacterized protein NAEGRDRAFT_75913 [Naegleria gruberi]EFC36373.1 predicted protein [Naegleria gruberi]|eukprot:XP_002669117.1 predicted protein [Naegleria gruberi strain NEG-M]
MTPLTSISNNAGNLQTSPSNQIYHYPIKVQTNNNNGKSDEVQYPSAPSFDEIDFPEYQIVNNVQMQTMTSNIFKPIIDSLSEVSEEEDYRMFSQFKEFINSQRGPVMNEEKLYSLYISFRERYQQQANVNNVKNSKQQSPTVVLVNKSRVPSSGNATKAKPTIVNPNSPTVSTTSSTSSTNSSGSNSEKRRDGLRDVRKKYEEQKLEEMRIKQMKERNKAHFAQEMQQPCMDYNALVMRENTMYNVPSNQQMGASTNSYPIVNNPNDVISNGTYIPFKASHPQQSNSHITSRAISNSTGAGYLNYNNNNYWPNNK